MSNVVVVIMAGGVGTRFWPLSTPSRPKQFLRLFGEHTLLQLSYDRVRALVPPERVLVLTNEVYQPLVAEQLPEIPPANIIGEPIRRDTAAAVALAALVARERFGNPVIVTLTADHVIDPVHVFQQTIRSAVASAAKGTAEHPVLLTFGIVPTYPATGYGYLELGEALPSSDGIRHYRLRRFVEKPPLSMATRYVASGEYLWNSGMFVWSAASIIAELKRLLPGHVEALGACAVDVTTPAGVAALGAAFFSLPTLSIDYGVMEKAQEVHCVRADFGWSDVGGWLALREFLPEDDHRNSLRGNVVTFEASDSIVFCEDEFESVVLVGVKDVVVVRSKGRTLIVHKDRTEDIKKVVSQYPDLSDDPPGGG